MIVQTLPPTAVRPWALYTAVGTAHDGTTKQATSLDRRKAVADCSTKIHAHRLKHEQ
jgi:hypothetical protein